MARLSSSARHASVNRSSESYLSQSFELSAAQREEVFAPEKPIKFERHGTGFGGPSFHSALMLTKGFIDKPDLDTDADPTASLSIPQAFMVLFCCAFGAGTAFQGWYPKLAGLYGYAAMILLVSMSAATASNALFDTARASGATSFQELCQQLPSWTGKVTPVCNIVWNFAVVANYVAFMYTFINNQILYPSGNNFDSLDRGEPLYFAVGVAVFLVCLPTNFGGSCMTKITAFNACVTWVVIITAIVKGFYTFAKLDEGKPSGGYEYTKPEGFPQVIVLLASAMFQVVPVPRLNSELRPELRERASIILPFGLALLQGSVFCIVGIAGHLALGKCVPDDGDTFAAYFDDYNDWMVLVLQAGISILMYLSSPMFSVVGKAELWGLIAPKDANGRSTPFENTSLVVRVTVNLATITVCVLLPMFMGRENYMTLFTIIAATFTTWMNIFLPSIVILWVNVLPARQKGDRWVGAALKSIWLFFLGLLALYMAYGKIADALGLSSSDEDPSPSC